MRRRWLKESASSAACFHGLFGTADQKEGMAAFVDKRAAAFTHR